jgi:hypothetical protein
MGFRLVIDFQYVIIVLLNVISFYLGAKIGQMTSKGEDLTIPTPAKAIDNFIERKEYKKQQEELNTMMDNIDRYDGSANGQKDV